MNLSNIFLGGVTGEHRRYMRELFEYLRLEGFNEVVIPCTGQNTITKTALEAGYSPNKIHTSDISLFSSMLGYLYSGQPLSELDFEVVDAEHYDWYKEQEDDLHRVAVLLFMMKLCQLREAVYYERCFINEMIENKEMYFKQLVEQLQVNLETFKGVQYQQQDVRDFFKADYPLTESTLIVMNPPAYAKGYEKMFAFGSRIKYGNISSEFDFRGEWIHLYNQARTLPCASLWYTSQNVLDKVAPEEVVYAAELGGGKFTYILCPRPELLDGFKLNRSVAFKKKSSENVVQYKMIDSNHELTMDDHLVIKEINKETALYYRDLFAHRLGSTVSEIYFGIFCNGQLMSACAFNTSFLRRLQANYVFESFCFSVAHKKYESLNRFSMMLLCSGEFKQYLEYGILKNSVYCDLQTFKTTCLTKYRKSKLNNGLLELKNSEKMENGTYKLTYEQPFYLDRTYKDCLRIYLEQDMRIKKSWKGSENKSTTDKK